MRAALEGIRVLDLTRVLAGPFTTMILGDLGAEVIKIETPAVGDDSRTYGPFIRGESTYFMSLNRNKRSLTLNLRSPQGKIILKKLVRKSDVLVENFRPGTMERFDLGYEVLREVNPKIVYATCSGFGSTGPYRGRAAYDVVVQGMGGIMSITGEPEGPPVRVGTSIGDITAGLFTVIGILSALRVREQTGRGQKVDVGMLDCQVAILENAVTRYLTTGEIPRPLGTRHPSITPFEAFKSKDYYVIIAVGNEPLWKKFCRFINKLELAEDARFKTNSLRTKNHSQLKPIIEEVTRLRDRNMFVEIEHPVAGKFKTTGIPIKLSETPEDIRTPSPLLGQHTNDILSEILGFASDEIELLRKDKVI